MPSLPKWKIFLSIVCTVFAIIYALPNFVDVNSKFLPRDTVNLGLDLRGGAHLLLDVDFENYLSGAMDNLVDNLRKSFRDNKIGYKNLSIRQRTVQFELRSLESLRTVKRIVNTIDSGIELTHENTKIKLHYSDSKLHDLLNKVIDQSIEIVRMRVDSTGTKEPILHRQGDRHILLQVPGAEDPTHLKNILGKTAKLTFHLVDEASDVEEAMKGKLPVSSMLMKGESDKHGEYYLVVKKKVILGGDQLKSASVSLQENVRPVVAFSFDNVGSRLFGEITKNNAGKRLAIVLDHKLLSAPVINEPILGGKGVISGDFTVESANELALLLRAGTLPAPLKIVEERTIGPNLGVDSIESGKKAGICGFILVVIFMTWSYGVLGIFASITLSIAMLYVLALLSLFQATLTLPGIAGIILTMGMAVDANVLIYERIKEELRKGASIAYSVKVGFESAFSTILDSNVTTLIVAFLLYIFGVGAIKGFAVTLTVGIISSMFSAIIITKLFIDIWIKYCSPKRLGL